MVSLQAAGLPEVPDTVAPVDSELLRPPQTCLLYARSAVLAPGRGQDRIQDSLAIPYDEAGTLCPLKRWTDLLEQSSSENT